MLKKIGKKLGFGRYGSVFEYDEHFGGKELCVKVVYKSDLDGFDEEKLESYIEREYDNLCKLNHPNIVSIVSADNRDEVCYFFMERVEGSTIEAIIKIQRGQKELLNFPILLPLLKQLVSAVKFCHQNKILLRDIKLSNIIISPDLTKATLIDFGLSYYLGNRENPSSQGGCEYYWSPEVFNGTQYSYPADVWSLGIVLYQFATLRYPFPGKKEKHIFYNINHGIFKAMSEKFPLVFRELFPRIFEVSPEKRILLDQIEYQLGLLLNASSPLLTGFSETKELFSIFFEIENSPPRYLMGKSTNFSSRPFSRDSFYSHEFSHSEQ